MLKLVWSLEEAWCTAAATVDRVQAIESDAQAAGGTVHQRRRRETPAALSFGAGLAGIQRAAGRPWPARPSLPAA
jgi:hypothetical protein